MQRNLILGIAAAALLLACATGLHFYSGAPDMTDAAVTKASLAPLAVNFKNFHLIKEAHADCVAAGSSCADNNPCCAWNLSCEDVGDGNGFLCQ